MKKMILLVALVSAALASSAESYLFWMVDTSQNGGGTRYDTASLYAVYGGGEKTSIGSYTYAEVLAGQDFIPSGAFVTSLGSESLDGWSYFIELTKSGSLVADTSATAITYASKPEFFGVGGIGAPQSSSNVYGIGSSATYAVPEPTSGLLVLIGGMLLGLRRKKVA